MTSPTGSTEPSNINVPNSLAAIRLVGSFVAAGVAWGEQSSLFLVLICLLMLTDWLDGKLAVLLDQQTTFGARLDSVADSAMYAAILFGCLWLQSELILQEAPWLIVGLVSYGVTSVAGLIKFRRLPSYHTRAAKACWLLAGIAVLALFLGDPSAAWTVWPLRIASLGVTWTNLEATAITFVLPEWRANIPSYWHARRSR